MRSRIMLVAAGVLLAMACGVASAQASKQLIDLGTLGGGAYSRAMFVNDSGQVVGTSEKAFPIPYSHAFSWTASGGIVDIIATDPAIGSVAVESNVVGVTDSGVVLGHFTEYDADYGQYFNHAFRWTAAGGLVDLTLPGDQFSLIRRVSRSGQVAGISSTLLRTRGFHWSEQDGVVELGLPAGATGIEVTGISRDGRHVIVAGQPAGSFLWTVADGYASTGGCSPVAVNDLGEVTGFFFPPPPATSRACFWSAAAGFVDLYAISTPTRGAIGQFINNAGEVAGGGNTAFYWRPGMGPAVHLGALGPEGMSSEPTGLTEEGLMVGVVAMMDDSFRAFSSESGAPMQEASLGGPSYPRAVNALGQLVGSSQILGHGRGFSWTATGGAIEMPTLGGNSSDASAVNNRGQVVGESATDDSGKARHAVLWNTRPLPKTPLVVALPDMNTDGVADIAVIRDEPIRAELRSGLNGSLLKTIGFLDGSMTPLAVRLLPDTDGNGAAELAVLAAHNSDSRGVVEMRNLTGAQGMRQVWFAVGQTPVALAVIAYDADGNGVPELAVLSTRNSDGRGLVEVKNAYGATNQTSIWVGAGLTPQDLEVVEDADKNGIPEVAVLSNRNSDGRVVVEIKNAIGATNPHSIWFMVGNMPIDLTVVNDADGNTVPEVAVLSRRGSDGRIVVEVKNATGAANSSAVWFAAGHAGLAVDAVGDADGNGVPELAVLSQRNSDGRVLVEVKNAAGATNARALWYPAGFTARDLTVFPDLDGNGIEEAGALLIRGTDGRILVESRNAAGAQGTKDHWFSP